MEAKKPEIDVEGLTQEGRRDLAVRLNEKLTNGLDDTGKLREVKEIVDYFHSIMRIQHPEIDRIKSEGRRGLAIDVRDILLKLGDSPVNEKVAAVRKLIGDIVTPQ